MAGGILVLTFGGLSCDGKGLQSSCGRGVGVPLQVVTGDWGSFRVVEGHLLELCGQLFSSSN